METYSVIANVTEENLHLDPYPYVVVDNCLPADYFRALAATYPSNDTILEYCRAHPFRQFNFVDGNATANDRYDISAFQMLRDAGSFPSVWIDFLRYHTSQAFFLEVVALFGREIRHRYPFLEPTLGRRLQDFTTGVRFDSESDISLDCQVGINTPATQETSVRRVHTDASVELFAALLYFKDEDDDTKGGDLEIFRWQDPKRRYFVGSEADESAAELVDTVAYKANRMVMFLNTQDSLHAVTSRAPSANTRRLVNIIGEVDKSYPKGLFPRRKRKDRAYFWGKAASLIEKLRER